MPKLKRSETERFNHCLAAEIRHGIDLYDLSVEKIGECVGVSRTTMYARLKNPQTFTLGELSALAKMIRKTPVSLLEAAENAL